MKMNWVRSMAILAFGLFMLTPLVTAQEPDECSHANPEQILVRHLDLDLSVHFEDKILKGTVVLDLQRKTKEPTAPLVLDTRGLTIRSVETTVDNTTWQPARFALGKKDPVLGQALRMEMPQTVTKVRVAYETGPESSALQWLAPAQTAGKQQPYLFTQSQAIDARSWIPLQDTPGVRFTYNARVRTPNGLVAVMSAGNDPKQKRTGDYRFEMTQPIPSYLMALAVGDIEFKAISPRTGVFAEPSVLARAAAEFADVEQMVQSCEKMYGPYRWGRYDVLVMPPSFPFGGMENPRLTFASPTTLAGDKSLVSLLAHELAHSWSGNLVTNATWRDFWLNEGFTVYLERRIMEQVYGKGRAQVEAVLGRRDLDRELTTLPKPEQVLHVKLNGRHPNESLTEIPYEKGCLFLTHLEKVYGRERLDAFLLGYFKNFSFQSITTDQFAAYLKKNLLDSDESLAAKVRLNEWLNEPGLPQDAPNPQTEALGKLEVKAAQFAEGKITADALESKTWSTQEWLHFLRSLPVKLGQDKMGALDQAFGLSASGNSEIVAQWLQMAIRNRYESAYGRLKRFLTEQGRRKFLKPLYQELVKSPEGKKLALDIYAEARPGYHPVSSETIDGILDWKANQP